MAQVTRGKEPMTKEIWVQAVIPPKKNLKNGKVAKYKLCISDTWNRT